MSVVAVQLDKPVMKVGLSGGSPLTSPSPQQFVADQSASQSGFAKSLRELPARYRRKPLDDVEIEYIQVSHLKLY